MLFKGFFLNQVSYLANSEGWIFQDLSTRYTTKWAKTAQFRKFGLNFEHFCLPALFNLISLPDAFSCSHSFIHSFPMPYADFQKQPKNFSYGSLSILILRKSHSGLPSVASSSSSCVLLQIQLQDLSVSRTIPNTTATARFYQQTHSDARYSWI